jgi:sialate O-acetylesterase
LIRRRITAVAATVLLSVPAAADVRLPAVIGDHMVLQRDVKARIWGWADPGEAVHVSVAGARAPAVAGADGG